MSLGDIEIFSISKSKDINRFIKLPWQIYNDDLYWVPPLIRDVKFKLNLKKNPFFEHAKMNLFIATKGNRCVGRIAVIINYRHIEFHNENLGFFGMFECIDDFNVAQSLLSAAEEWCRNEGMNRIRGPVSLSMNDECGFLLVGYDSSPVLMMPYNPNYYLKFCEMYGFVKVKDLYAYLKKEVQILGRLQKLAERVRRKMNLAIRPLNMKKFDEEVEIIKDIYNSALELNWGFVPMTTKEINQLAKELKPIVEPELVLFAEADGHPIGISITLPDYNQVLKRLNGSLGPINILRFLYYKRKITGLRSIIFGVKKEYRGSGIPIAMYYETEKTGRRLGYGWCELSWNLEDNDLINRFDEAIGGKLYKKYRLYEKKIS